MGIFKKKVEFFDCVNGDYTSSWVMPFKWYEQKIKKMKVKLLKHDV